MPYFPTRRSSDLFKRLSRAYLPSKIDQNIRYVFRVVNDSFKNFLVGETIEAAILGSLVALSMWIFQFPYAGMIGALTGVTAYIPYVGAYISAGRSEERRVGKRLWELVRMMSVNEEKR